jgi:hypothetical protein
MAAIVHDGNRDGPLVLDGLCLCGCCNGFQIRGFKRKFVFHGSDFSGGQKFKHTARKMRMVPGRRRALRCWKGTFRVFHLQFLYVAQNISCG